MALLKRSTFLKVFLAAVVALGIGFWLWNLSSTGYFSHCNITYDKYDHPLITINLQGHSYELEMRIGSRFPLSLSQDILDLIDKQPQGITLYHDLNGHSYEAPTYLIPKIRVGNLILTNILAHLSLKEDGNILGKYLGGEFNLLLDFPHSRIIACDTFLKLQARKLVSNHWIRAPFESNCGGIVLQVNTEMGDLKLAINTTSTLTLIRSSLTDSEKLTNSFTFSIGEQEFGTITFQSIDLPDGLSEIDGFIGMNFLKNHGIYLDYSNQTAYIEPPLTYFEHFPVIFGNRALPTIDVSIEEKIYPLEIDLGSSFLVSLNHEVLKNIHKTPCDTAEWSDFKGNRYQSPAYTIPEIKIGNLILPNVFSKQNREDFHVNVSFETLACQPIGAIGRPILEKYNLFLDFPHSAIYASNSHKRLQRAGLLSKNPLVIPFILHPDGILLSVETDAGIQRLLLDTGATHTAIRTPYPTSTSQFRLMGHDFGKRSIIPIDLCPRLDYEGFLGLDFLREYSLFIDYPNKLIFLDLAQE